VQKRTPGKRRRFRGQGFGWHGSRGPWVSTQGQLRNTGTSLNKNGPTSTCVPIGPGTTTPTYPARGYLSTGQSLLKSKRRLIRNRSSFLGVTHISQGPQTTQSLAIIQSDVCDDLVNSPKGTTLLRPVASIRDRNPLETEPAVRKIKGDRLDPWLLSCFPILATMVSVAPSHP